MMTGETFTLTKQQGETDSLQSRVCAGFTAQDASPHYTYKELSRSKIQV